MFAISLSLYSSCFHLRSVENQLCTWPLAYRCCGMNRPRLGYSLLRPGFMHKHVVVIPNHHLTWWEGLFLRHPIWGHMEYAQSNGLSAYIACIMQNESYRVNILNISHCISVYLQKYAPCRTYYRNILLVHILGKDCFHTRQRGLCNQEAFFFMVAITTWSSMHLFRGTGGQGLDHSICLMILLVSK